MGNTHCLHNVKISAGQPSPACVFRGRAGLEGTHTGARRAQGGGGEACVCLPEQTDKGARTWAGCSRLLYEGAYGGNCYLLGGWPNNESQVCGEEKMSQFCCLSR